MLDSYHTGVFRDDTDTLLPEYHLFFLNSTLKCDQNQPSNKGICNAAGSQLCTSDSKAIAADVQSHNRDKTEMSLAEKRKWPEYIGCLLYTPEHTPPVNLSSPFRVFWRSCIKQLAPKQSTQKDECNMPDSGYTFITWNQNYFCHATFTDQCISKVENPSE